MICFSLMPSATFSRLPFFLHCNFIEIYIWQEYTVQEWRGNPCTLGLELNLNNHFSKILILFIFDNYKMNFSYLSIFLCKLFLPALSKSEQATCSREPLLEFVTDCDARDSICNYKIQSATKKLNSTLNGPMQITFDESSMSDALKLKRCIRISPHHSR